MKPIHAIFENGVFRPLEHVELPEHTRVEFEVRRVEPADGAPAQEGAYRVLAERYDSGEPDVAARHDEHQP